MPNTTGEPSQEGGRRVPPVLKIAGWVLAAPLGLGVTALALGPGPMWVLQHVDGISVPTTPTTRPNPSSSPLSPASRPTPSVKPSPSPSPSPSKLAPSLEGKDLAAAVDSIRGRMLSIGTGILAVLAIVYTAANAKSARRTAEAAQKSAETALIAANNSDEANRETFELTQQGLRQSEEAQRQTFELTERGQRLTLEQNERGQITARFTAAVAQLGDQSPAIQLGGVHALAGIADDAIEMRQTCIDVLCAYLRLPYDQDPGPTSEATEASKSFRAQREVRHTIVRLIGAHLRRPASARDSWQGYNFDFTDVIFDGGDFHGANFTHGEVSFKGAAFVGGNTNFSKAVFAGASAQFWSSQFTGGIVVFDDVTVSSGVLDFTHARVDGAGVYFSIKATGGLISFESADFQSGYVHFEGSRFLRGPISFANAEFGEADVNFSDVEISTAIDFTDATGRVPAGLDTNNRRLTLPAAWVPGGTGDAPIAAS